MAYRYIEQWQNIINLDQRDENSEQKIVSSIVEGIGIDLYIAQLELILPALDNGDLDFPKFVTGIASYVEDQDDLTVAGQSMRTIAESLISDRLQIWTCCLEF